MSFYLSTTQLPKYLGCLILLMMFTVSGTLAQTLSTTNKRALKFFDDAKKYELDRDFDKAISVLEKALTIDPKFAEAHQRLGMYYGTLRELKKSREHFEKALAANPTSKNLHIATIEISTFELTEGKYERALALAKKYLSLNPPAKYIRYTKRAKNIIATCEFALEGMKNPVDFNPRTLDDSVNKFKHQFFPVLTADQQTMMFTALNANKNEDIYECVRLEDGSWSAPRFIKELNTPYNEGTCSISADGKTIIFTSCEGGERKRQNYGSCDLFISKKVGGVWSPPRNMGSAINTKYWESQPAISADGRKLYFSSNRPGGKGGRDIWVSELDSRDKWTRPRNMQLLNTPGQEFSPFIHVNDLTLFFSSDGHGGYGRLDLFRSDRDSLGYWTKPKNLGFPINNHGDQVALFITADGTKGYYSDGIMENNIRVKDVINEFDIPIELKIEKASDVVQGVVYDSKTKEKLEAKIDLIDLASEKVISSVNSDLKNGDYLITLASGAEYALYVNKEGYLFKSLSFNYKEKTEAQVIELDIYLDPIEKGKTVTLNNIFFEFGSYDLADKSKTELNKLVKFMKENPETKIEIGAHTDNVGSDESNQQLSLKRADSVVSFLKKKGVPEANVISYGYGESKPIASNDTDEGRAKNRRIEFKVL
ncbi:MAG: OmpA family protein [Flammeovirgaceae bacterium]